MGGLSLHFSRLTFDAFLRLFSVLNGRPCCERCSQSKNCTREYWWGDRSYVVVSFGDRKRKTAHKANTLAPEWQERFEFVTTNGLQHLQLRLYDKNFKTDELMGTADINLLDLDFEKSDTKWCVRAIMSLCTVSHDTQLIVVVGAVAVAVAVLAIWYALCTHDPAVHVVLAVLVDFRLEIVSLRRGWQTVCLWWKTRGTTQNIKTAANVTITTTATTAAAAATTTCNRLLKNNTTSKSKSMCQRRLDSIGTRMVDPLAFACMCCACMSGAGTTASD
jgi:hypothetical protein